MILLDFKIWLIKATMNSKPIKIHSMLATAFIVCATQLIGLISPSYADLACRPEECESYGQMLINNKKYYEAISVLNISISRYPINLGALLLRAEANNLAGNLQAAVFDYTKYIDKIEKRIVWENCISHEKPEPLSCIQKSNDARYIRKLIVPNILKALRSRAYVLQIIGRHRDAEEDLAMAKKYEY